MSTEDQINKLDKKIAYLRNRKKRLESGEELCDHHWNGSDQRYECYCTTCDSHIAEIKQKDYIPFKSEALCTSCKKGD